MSKKVAILFSGGLDSTYLVWKNLKEGNVVLPIYVEIENNEVKTTMEKKIVLNYFIKNSLKNFVQTNLIMKEN